MTKQELQEYGEFVTRYIVATGERGCEHEGIEHEIATECAELWTIARALHTLAEVACNEGMTPAQQTRDDKLQLRASQLCARRGLTCRHNGDPRGFALYINLPSGASNSWGGEGWGIG